MAVLDFQQPIVGDGYSIYYPFEGRGAHLLTPDKLQPAVHPDGVPDVRLQLYRGSNPMLPPQPYGVLDMRLETHYPFEEALAALRETHPQSRIEPAYLTGGCLRLLASGDADWPEEACRPVPLHANGYAGARFLVRLSLEGAQFMKELLVRDSLPVRAQAELELTGIAPRLPVKVAFDPMQLHRQLAELADEAGLVSRRALIRFFSEQPASIGLTVVGEPGSFGELADTMADWVRSRYGTFAAAPVADGLGYLALNVPNSGSGKEEWDLSQPMTTWRTMVVSLEPFRAARQAIASAGPEAIVPPPVIVPPLAAGFHQVDISANIQEPGPGVSAVGVTLRAAPHPPARPQAVTVSTELSPSLGSTFVRLKLSPREPLAYTFSTFVITENSQGIRQLDGPEMAGSGERLSLKPDSFPVRFVPVVVRQELLELATIHGRCEWLEADHTTASTAFVLDRDRPKLAVAIPATAANATFAFDIRSAEGDRSLQLGPLPAEPLLVGLHLFPEYGPQQVSIELAESSSLTLAAIDLLPENREETSEAVTVLALTSNQPKKLWSYLASSPFYPGFRYRKHAGAGESPEPWSEIQSPFERLVLDA